MLYTPVANDITRNTDGIWQRPDIQVLRATDGEKLTSMTRPIYVMLMTRPGFYDDVAQYCVAHLNPVYKVQLQGVPLMQIYRLPSPYQP